MAKIRLDNDTYKIKPLEMATLLVNLHLAAQHPLIGHGDHIVTLDDMTRRLNVGELHIKKDRLEAALWACNMLDEMGELWTPWVEKSKIKSLTEFDRLIENIKLPYGYKFDRFYNVIEDKRRNKNG